MDGYGIKFSIKQHVQQLINVLQINMSSQWTRTEKIPGIRNRLGLLRFTRHNFNSKLHKPRTTQISTPPQLKYNKLSVRVQKKNLQRKSRTHRHKIHQKTAPSIKHDPCPKIHQDTSILINSMMITLMVCVACWGYPDRGEGIAPPSGIKCRLIFIQVAWVQIGSFWCPFKIFY